jgi:phospholipid N-methyltransferase
LAADPFAIDHPAVPSERVVNGSARDLAALVALDDGQAVDHLAVLVPLAAELTNLHA